VSPASRGASTATWTPGRQSRRRQEAELARREAEDARREAEQAAEALREIPVVFVEIARPARRSRGAEVEVTVENRGRRRLKEDMLTAGVSKRLR
jgi:RNA 3'-terminal phosphate cyclase